MRWSSAWPRTRRPGCWSAPGIPVLVVTASYRAQGRVAAVGVATYRADTCRLTFGESGMVDVAPVAAPAPTEVRAAS